MNNCKLKDDLEELYSDKEILEKALADTNKKIEDMYILVNKCAIFSEEILDYICALLSHFEEKTFIPFIYTKSDAFLSLNKVFENVFVGITDEINFERYIKDNDAEKLINDKSSYLIFQNDVRVVDKIQSSNSASISFDFDSIKEQKKCLAFEFLLKEYNNKNSCPVEVSHYNFDDYPYVQDFIRYLFEVQYEKKGEQLTSDEMFMVLRIFFKNEIDKPKQMIRENKN